MRVAVLRTAEGGVVCARLQLAQTPLARLRGLLGRASLAPDQGMLFRPARSIHTFFMRFPIDAIFCDRELYVLTVRRGLPPWRTAGARGARVVVELAAGAAAEIKPGDRLLLEQ